MLIQKINSSINNYALLSKSLQSRNNSAAMTVHQPSFGSDEISKKAKAARIWETIGDSKDIIILTHSGPDGDAIGSGLAMLNLIQKYHPQKDVKFLVPEGCPKDFVKFNGANEIKKFVPSLNEKSTL